MIYTKEEFKKVWTNDAIGITLEDLVDCAKDWKLFEDPSNKDLTAVTNALMIASDIITMDKFHNGSRMHKFSIPFGIKKNDAIELQKQMGYHPAGYGFYSFDATMTETTWLCADSCD
jgi:hypothetical protein